VSDDLTRDDPDNRCVACGQSGHRSSHCPQESGKAAKDKPIWGPANLEAMKLYPTGGAAAVVKATGLTAQQVYQKAASMGLVRLKADGTPLIIRLENSTPLKNRYGLTRRELDVLRGIAKGRGLKGAAREVGIELSTANGYMKSIFSKMAVKCQVSAILKAERAGMLEGIRP
jgi:DNA-binding CsgD family transcriptional regulator